MVSPQSQLLSLLLIGQQLAMGGTSSLALVMHRHGDFGIHGHFVSAHDIDSGVGNSSRYGHKTGGDRTFLSGDAMVLCVIAGVGTMMLPTVDLRELCATARHSNSPIEFSPLVAAPRTVEVAQGQAVGINGDSPHHSVLLIIQNSNALLI